MKTNLSSFLFQRNRITIQTFTPRTLYPLSGIEKRKICKYFTLLQTNRSGSATADTAAEWQRGWGGNRHEISTHRLRASTGRRQSSAPPSGISQDQATKTPKPNWGHRLITPFPGCAAGPISWAKLHRHDADITHGVPISGLQQLTEPRSDYPDAATIAHNGFSAISDSQHWAGVPPESTFWGRQLKLRFGRQHGFELQELKV